MAGRYCHPTHCSWGRRWSSGGEAVNDLVLIQALGRMSTEKCTEDDGQRYERTPELVKGLTRSDRRALPLEHSLRDGYAQ